MTIAGEFSAGFTDCGLWIRGVDIPSTGQNCSQWFDASTWDDNTKEGLMTFVMASMDALGDWFYWTWKVCHRRAVLVLMIFDFNLISWIS